MQSGRVAHCLVLLLLNCSDRGIKVQAHLIIGVTVLNNCRAVRFNLCVTLYNVDVVFFEGVKNIPKPLGVFALVICLAMSS